MQKPSSPAERLIKLVTFSLIAVASAALLPTAGNVEAQYQSVFTNTSLYGLYAAYTTDENRAAGDVAFAGHFQFDGIGQFTASGMQNLPLPNDGERFYESVAFDGSYNIEEGGLGTIEHDGLIWDIVVTETPRNSLTRRVLSFHAIARRAVNNSLMSMEFRRMDDKTDFTNAELRGLYSITFSIGDHGAGGMGVVYFDGSGHINGSCMIAYADEYDDQPHETWIVQNGLTGSYENHNNGWGTLYLTLTSADGSVKNLTHDFMIAGVEVFGPFTVPSDLLTLQREHSNEALELTAMELKRIED